MKPEIGSKYLITVDAWFVAPDGELYKSVFGTVHGINNDNDTLGIKTNRHSTDWYVLIGNMVVAGCQVHYAIKTDKVSMFGPKFEGSHEGVMIEKNQRSMSRIYHADE